MIKKHIKRGKEVKGNIMVINSSDGAVHSFTNTKEARIVSCSSQLFHQDYFAHGIRSSSSSNILTWMNSLTDETTATDFPHIIPILEQQAIIQPQVIRDGCTFWWYRLDDAKSIYLLTQHAQWSQTLKPFLLCDCDK